MTENEAYRLYKMYVEQEHEKMCPVVLRTIVVYKLYDYTFFPILLLLLFSPDSSFIAYFHLSC